MEKKSSELLKLLPFGQVLNSIPCGLFLVDSQQEIVFWNDEAERITGYPAADAIGRHCSFLAGLECGTGCALLASRTGKSVKDASCHIRAKTGELVLLKKNVDVLTHDGRIVGGIESFLDLTRQTRLEQKLRQHAETLEETVRARTTELETERSRLSSLLEAMDDPIYITRSDHVIVYANRALRDIFGEVTGDICFKAFYQLDQACSNCSMPRILEQQTFREERLNPINQRTYEIIHSPIFDSLGEVQKLSVCRDITERKNTENALLRANQELDAFVHTVSHDLRSPLTPVIGYAEFLQSEYRDQFDPKSLDMLHEIELQGQKMLKIMEDLLELARVGQLQPPREKISLQQVVFEVLEELQQAIIDRHADIQLEALPAARLPATLAHQLFSNLIGNALSYGCPPGGRIEIGGSRTGQLLSLYVRDFGPGIPVAERGRVSELFYRGSTGARQTGTGIGLAIVEKIAGIYHGQLRIEETPGGGCTIRVELLEPPAGSAAP